MKKKLVGLIAIFSLSSLPLATVAAQTRNPQIADAGNVATKGGMFLLGTDVQNGIQAMAHLQAPRKTLATPVRANASHLMVIFVDTGTGKAVPLKKANVKIKSPSNAQGPPISMVRTGDRFGANVILTEKGRYQFTVGATMESGQKRTFHFTYTRK